MPLVSLKSLSSSNNLKGWHLYRAWKSWIDRFARDEWIIPLHFLLNFIICKEKRTRILKFFWHSYIYTYSSWLPPLLLCIPSTLFSSKALNGSSSFVGALCIWRLAHFNKIGVEEQRPCANPFFKSLHNWKNSSSEKLIFQFPFILLWDIYFITNLLGIIIVKMKIFY